VIREAAPGAYYFDELSYEALRAARRRMLMVVLLFTLIMMIAMFFAARTAT
jgi:hypothetical protein